MVSPGAIRVSLIVVITSVETLYDEDKKGSTLLISATIAFQVFHSDRVYCEKYAGTCMLVPFFII